MNSYENEMDGIFQALGNEKDLEPVLGKLSSVLGLLQEGKLEEAGQKAALKYLPTCVSALVNRVEEFPQDMRDVISKFQEELLQRTFQTNAPEEVSFWDGASRVFYYPHCRFYHTNMPSSEEFSEVFDSNEENVEEFRLTDENSLCLDPNVDIKHGYLLINIARFFKLGGFDIISKRLKDKAAPPSIGCVKFMLKSVHRLYGYLHEEFFLEFIKVFMEDLTVWMSSVDASKLKVEEFNSLCFLLRVLSDMLDSSNEIPDELREHFQLIALDVADKQLKCPFLERRLNGLSEIRDVVVNVFCGEDPSQLEGDGLEDAEQLSKGRYCISKARVAEFMKSRGVIGYLFGANMHVELLRRSSDILRIFLQEQELSDADLVYMWKSGGGKHETILYCLYSIFGELSGAMNNQQLMLFYSLLKEVHFEDYSFQFIYLIQKFTVHAISRLSNPSDETVPEFGLELLWDFMTDSKTTCSDLIGHAYSIFLELLGWNLAEPHRLCFARKCVDNIRAQKCVCMTLRIFSKLLLITSFKVLEDSLEEVVACFFREFVNFKQDCMNVKRCIQDQADFHADNIDWSSVEIYTSCTFAEELQTRLEFLNVLYIDQFSPSTFNLSLEHAKMLWNNSITESFCESEKSWTYEWFTSHCTDPHYHALKYDTFLCLFESEVKRVDVKLLDMSSFHFMKSLLSYLSTNCNEMSRFNDRHKGLDFVWTMALNAENSEVGQEAINFIIVSYMDFGKEEMRTCIEYFVETCLFRLKSAREELHFADKSCENLVNTASLKIARCIKILTNYLDAFEQENIEGVQKMYSKGDAFTIFLSIPGQPSRKSIQVYENQTVKDLRIAVASAVDPTLQQKAGAAKMFRLITSGRELSEDVNSHTLRQERIMNKQIINVMKRPGVSLSEDMEMDTSEEQTPVAPSIRGPKEILSEQRHFEVIFALLDASEYIARHAWAVLMILPTNETMFHCLEKIDKQSPEVVNNVLTAKSAYKLFYALRIIDELADGGDEGVMADWCTKFCDSGGVQRLVELMMNWDLCLEELMHKSSIQLKCLGLLLKLVSLFCADTSFLEYTEYVGVSPFVHLRTNLIKTDLMELVRHWMGILVVVSKLEIENESVGGKDFRRSESIDDVNKNCGLLVASACFHDASVVQRMYDDPELDSWLTNLLFEARNENSGSVFADLLRYICGRVVENDFSKVLKGNIPLKYFLNYLLKYLPTSLEHGDSCDNYFGLLQNLIIDSLMDPSLRFEVDYFFKPTADLVHMLCEIETEEISFMSEEDKRLSGILGVLKAIFQNYPAVVLDPNMQEAIEKLSDCLFVECLFQVPTPAMEAKNSLPKCKTISTRSVGMEVVVILCSISLKCFKNVLPRIEAQNMNASHRLHQWNYFPSGMSKAGCGYVGLKNLGATCYMNSLLQQLFMIPAFRNRIFNVQDNSQEPSESILYQMQQLFAHLSESEYRSYNTRPFCYSYKDYDGEAMNVGLQMDVDEFLSVLFDRLEGFFKNTPEEKLVNNVFGGKLLQQIISKDCEHISEREENFFVVQCEVQNKKSIEESLGLFVEGEMLEGDNKYHCAKCNKHVTALKRSCIKSLPEILILHLKRFEFDMELMRRIKVNDFCEFKHHLNMEPYTLKGCSKAEKDEKFASGSDIGLSDTGEKNLYEYELSGILVHTGTADSGHYYSFIKERETRDTENKLRWLQFNDSLVEEFDPNDIPKHCFGGADVVKQFDPALQKEISRWQQKPYSAYMLFYDRVSEASRSARRHPSTASINLHSRDGDSLPTPRLSAQLSSLSTTSLHKYSLTNLESVQLSTGPLPKFSKPTIPPEIMDEVHKMNYVLLKDIYIFDEQYGNFLKELILNQREDIVTNCSEQDLAAVRLMTVKVACRYCFDTLSHAKFKGNNIQQWMEYLDTIFSSHSEVSKWFLSHLSEDQSWILGLLLICPIPAIRSAFMGLIIAALRSVESPSQDVCMDESMKLEDADEVMSDCAGCTTIVKQFVEAYVSLIPDAAKYTRNFDQFFSFFGTIAEEGDPYCDMLIEKGAIRPLVITYLSGEGTSSDSMGEEPKIFQPLENMSSGSFQTVVAVSNYLIAYLVKKCDGDMAKLSSVAPEGCNNAFLMNNAEYITKQIKEGIDPSTTDVVAALCTTEPKFCSQILRCVYESLDPTFVDSVKSCFSAFSACCEIEDAHQEFRINLIMKYVLKFACDASKNHNTKASLTAVHFARRLASHVPGAAVAAMELYEEWIPELIMNFPLDVLNSRCQDFILELTGHSQTEGSELVDSITGQARLEKIFFLLCDQMENAGTLITTLRYEEMGNRGGGRRNSAYSTCRLVPYLNLIRKFLPMIKMEDKGIVALADRVADLLSKIDGNQVEMDDNKKVATLLLLELVEANEACLDAILLKSSRWGNFMEYWISLNSKEVCVEYNKITLVAYYKLVLACCARSKDFLELWAMHPNFEWAVQHILILTQLFSNDVGVLLRKLIIESSAFDKFRLSFIEHLLKSKCSQNVLIIDILSILMKSDEDVIAFCSFGGPNLCTRIFVQIRELAEDAFNASLKVAAFNLMAKVLELLKSQKKKKSLEFMTFINAWDTRKEMLIVVLKYINSYTPLAFRDQCIEFVKTVVELDSALSVSAIKAMYQSHELFYSLTGQEMAGSGFGSKELGKLFATLCGEFSPMKDCKCPCLSVEEFSELKLSLKHNSKAVGLRTHVWQVLLDDLPSFKSMEMYRNIRNYFVSYYDLVMDVCKMALNLAEASDNRTIVISGTEILLTNATFKLLVLVAKETLPLKYRGCFKFWQDLFASEDNIQLSTLNAERLKVMVGTGAFQDFFAETLKDYRFFVANESVPQPHLCGSQAEEEGHIVPLLRLFYKEMKRTGLFTKELGESIVQSLSESASVHVNDLMDLSLARSRSGEEAVSSNVDGLLGILRAFSVLTVDSTSTVLSVSSGQIDDDVQHMNADALRSIISPLVEVLRSEHVLGVGKKSPDNDPRTEIGESASEENVSQGQTIWTDKLPNHKELLGLLATYAENGSF
eukprot:Nk52_evm52s343 gene=Nk52_evmTU52s343